MADVEAELTFAVDTGEKPAAVSTGPTGRVEHRGTFETRRVLIRDLREADERSRLDVQGFERLAHESGASFRDAEDIERRYHPEAEGLIAQHSGAQRVVVFDHTLRTSDDAEQVARRQREPVRMAHNDYTERSAVTRLKLALPDEADAWLARRFAIIQLWRPIGGPVLRDPLALCDARTVHPDDLVATERRHRDRVGEIYNLAHRSSQRWFYVPELRPDEPLMFKVFDSDHARARFTPHTSFAWPATSPAVPPRRSIEVRALAVF